MLIRELAKYATYLEGSGLLPEKGFSFPTRIDYEIKIDGEGKILGVESLREFKDREVIPPFKAQIKGQPEFLDVRGKYLFGVGFNDKSESLLYDKKTMSERDKFLKYQLLIINPAEFKKKYADELSLINTTEKKFVKNKALDFIVDDGYSSGLLSWLSENNKRAQSSAINGYMSFIGLNHDIETHEKFMIDLLRLVGFDIDKSINMIKEISKEEQKKISNFVKSNFRIVVVLDSGNISIYDDYMINERWLDVYESIQNGIKSLLENGQCSITAKKNVPIAKVHDRLAPIPNGQSTGMSLISYNGASSASYGLEQSYNSRVSYDVMKKYTSAYNYVMKNRNNYLDLDDMRMIFWPVVKAGEYQNDPELYEDIFMSLTVKNENASLDASSEYKEIIKSIYAGNPLIPKDKESTEFFIAELKPNSARTSVVFTEKTTFKELVDRFVRANKKLKMNDDDRPLLYFHIPGLFDLYSDKIKGTHYLHKNDKSRLITSIMHGAPIPTPLGNRLVDVCLRGVVKEYSRNEKIDDKIKKVTNIYRSISNDRIRLLRMCMIDNGVIDIDSLKTLDEEFDNPMYLCGRMLSLLESAQVAMTKHGHEIDVVGDAFKEFLRLAAVHPSETTLKMKKKRDLMVKKSQKKGYYNLIYKYIKSFDKAYSKIGDFNIKSASYNDKALYLIGYYNQKTHNIQENKKDERI